MPPNLQISHDLASLPFCYTMLSSPFPPDIAFACVTPDIADKRRLPDDEEFICEKWLSPERRQQFRMGRLAAHFALETLGGNAWAPILRGPAGEPLWPCSFTGCISNTTGCAIAAAAHLGDYYSLGLDLERKDRRINPNIRKFICTEAEADKMQSEEDLLFIFTAKECLYKALYPLCSCFISFQDMELNREAETGAWSVVPRKKLPIDLCFESLRIFTNIASGYVLSYMAIPDNSRTR